MDGRKRRGKNGFRVLVSGSWHLGPRELEPEGEERGGVKNRERGATCHSRWLQMSLL